MFRITARDIVLLRVSQITEKPKSFLSVVALSLFVVCGGCGGSSASTPPPPPQVINIAGNWQIAAASSIFGITTDASGSIAQNGSSVSGQLALTGTPCSTSAAFTGAISGKNLAATLVEAGAAISFAGTISADGSSASGTYAAPIGGCTSGDFGTWSGIRVSGNAQAQISSVVLNPAVIAGGFATTGTVTISAAAPSGGALVTLANNDSLVVNLPSSVTVAAGFTSATFNVMTASVNSSTQVSVSGTYNGTKSSSLTVNPVSSASSNITGDWQANFISSVFTQSGTIYGYVSQSQDVTTANLHVDGSPCFSAVSTTGIVSGSSVQFTATENGQAVTYTGNVSPSGTSMGGSYEIIGGCGNGDRGTWTAVMLPVGQCVTPPNNLLSWWKGDGNAADVTSANPGSALGGISYGAGMVSEAFSFDGSTGYVNVPDSVSLDNITTAVSVEMWANPNPPLSGVGWEYLYSRRQPIAGESFSVYILSTGALGIILRTTSSPTTTGSKFESAPGAVSFGQFHHIAATTNTTTGVAKAYIDGVLVPLTVAYGPSTFSGTFASVNQLYLGRREDLSVGEGLTGAGYYNGLLDEITLYPIELDEGQIQFIYHAGSAGKCVLH